MARKIRFAQVIACDDFNFFFGQRFPVEKHRNRSFAQIAFSDRARYFLCINYYGINQTWSAVIMDGLNMIRSGEMTRLPRLRHNIHYVDPQGI